MGDPAPIARRAFLSRAGAASVGAIALWSTPSIRSTPLQSGSVGTPAPPATLAAEAAPAAVADPAGSEEILPLTGEDPGPLLTAGGAAIAAGAAMIAAARDTQASRTKP
jgi:LPXTG-motif cell wall-anchored protein